jgi:hypothetical protein
MLLAAHHVDDDGTGFGLDVPDLRQVTRGRRRPWNWISRVVRRWHQHQPPIAVASTHVPKEPPGVAICNP